MLNFTSLEKLKKGGVSIEKIATNHNQSNALTKSLNVQKIIFYFETLNVATSTDS